MIPFLLIHSRSSETRCYFVFILSLRFAFLSLSSSTRDSVTHIYCISLVRARSRYFAWRFTEQRGLDMIFRAFVRSIHLLHQVRGVLGGQQCVGDEFHGTRLAI